MHAQAVSAEWINRAIQVLMSKDNGRPGQEEGHVVCRSRPVFESQLSHFQNLASQLFHKLNYVTLQTKVLHTQNSPMSNYFTTFSYYLCS